MTTHNATTTPPLSRPPPPPSEWSDFVGKKGQPAATYGRKVYVTLAGYKGDHLEYANQLTWNEGLPSAMCLITRWRPAD